MRRRFGVVVGFDLDDDAADPIDKQRRTDQFGRDFKDIASKERALERFAYGGWS